MTLKTLLSRTRRGALTGLLAVAMSAGLMAAPKAAEMASASAAACGHFPKVELWNELSHDFVRQHVENRYGGDWDLYIAGLERYESKLKSIHDEGLRARVTWRNMKISIGGDQLAHFLKLVEQRREVTQCLAGTESLAEFSTAAGGEPAERGAPAQHCSAIPDVEWWAFTSHDEIVDYVNRRHGGDFLPYIEKWDIRLRKLQDIDARGSTAVTSTGLTLRGASLRKYMNQMQTRNLAVQCLAELHGSGRS